MTQAIPHIMPFEMDAFNNDHFIGQEILKLKDKFGIYTACETGTAFGSSTMWFAENFKQVFTVESNKQYLEIAIERWNERLGKPNNIAPFLGKSETVLADIFNIFTIGNNSLVFADAHWGNDCPLLDELNAIHQHGIRPVIVIHDVLNPNDGRFGYDTYNGQDFTFEWLKPSLDLIYGEGEYEYYFNTGFKQESAQRGVLYCIPKI